MVVMSSPCKIGGTITIAYGRADQLYPRPRRAPVGVRPGRLSLVPLPAPAIRSRRLAAIWPRSPGQGQPGGAA